MTEQKNTLAMVQKDTVDIVSVRIREFQEKGELYFPANYSPENAMKAAWLTIQETIDRNSKPAVEVCTKNSIANALLNMVVQGLNPAKKQCYFIVYGDKLTLQRSYFGSMHIAKTVNPEIEDIISDVIYDGDVFAFKKIRGKTVISTHEQNLDNINKHNIKAAYCSIFYKDGKEDTTIMTMDEIKQAWRQSKKAPIDENGKIKAGSTHDKFAAEMCKKTVVNRACKVLINASDDSNLLIKVFKETQNDIAEAKVEEEIAENANKTPLVVNVDTGEVTDEEPASETAPAPSPNEDELP